MNILFISRATLYTVRGGDTVQMECTASALRKLGVQVTIALCNDKNINYSAYQLIHFFNIIRPADILYHIDKSGLPFVVSPIYMSYKEMEGTSSIRQQILSLLGKHAGEYIKTIARAIKNGERIVSYKYLWMGHRRSIQYILKKCTHLLPNSLSEYRRLKAEFPEAGSYSIVPNAIDTSVFNIGKNDEGREQDTVLCVARFEPLKNQLNVIKALNDSPYKVTFVGNIAPNHCSYYKACQSAAGENISFLSFKNKEEIVALYRKHKVHILASWFETTGLSSLEAIACGCNIVISKKGDTEEYFGDHAFYCDPGDTESIRAAVDKAMAAKTDRHFMETISIRNNWDVTAVETYRTYQNVLSA